MMTRSFFQKRPPTPDVAHLSVCQVPPSEQLPVRNAAVDVGYRRNLSVDASILELATT